MMLNSHLPNTTNSNMKRHYQLLFILSFILLAAPFTPARAQSIFKRDKAQETPKAEPEEKEGILSIFKKKEPTESDKEMDAVKARHKDAKTDVRAYKKERKAAEAREEAARARAEAVKAEKQALKAEEKAKKADKRAEKAREKAGGN